MTHRLLAAAVIGALVSVASPVFGSELLLIPGGGTRAVDFHPDHRTSKQTIACKTVLVSSDSCEGEEAGIRIQVLKNYPKMDLSLSRLCDHGFCMDLYFPSDDLKPIR